MNLNPLLLAGRLMRARFSRASIATGIRCVFLAALVLVAGRYGAIAQEDLTLGDGIPVAGGGFISTGSGYDMRSGRMQRTVDDFVVTGSIGGNGLRQTRTCYTFASSDRLDAVWVMNPYDYKPVASTSTTYRTIRYPDGSKISFRGPTSDGVTHLKAEHGGKDRIKLSGTAIAELWLGDGTSILFSGDRPYQVRDPNGLRIFLQYGSYGLSAAVDETGRRIDYTYTSSTYSTTLYGNVRLIQRATGSDGQWVEYTFDSAGHVTSALYSDGSTASYTYSTWRGAGTSAINRGIPSIFRDVRARARMQAVKFRFVGKYLAPQDYPSDSGLVLLEESDPDSGAIVSQREGPMPSTWTSSSIVKPYEEYRGSGGYWEYYFNRSNLLSITDGQGNTTSFSYSGAKLTGITDALGRSYAFENEPSIGRQKKVTLPDGSYRELTFTSAGFPYFIASRRDELGRITTYDRFPNGTLGQITYPDGSTEGWAYNALNQPTIHRFRNGAHEWFEYDAAGRLTRRWLPSFGGQVASETYTYYPNGHAWEDRVETMTDANGKVTRYEYDYAFSGGVQGSTPCAGRGLVTKTTYHDGSYTTAAYDVYGRTVWSENELRQRTSNTYDAYGRVLTRKDPLNRTTTYDYSPGSGLSPMTHTEDKPTLVTLPSGKRTKYVYDSNFRLVSETVGDGTADAATTTHAYDAVGNETSVTDPVGRVTSFAYDSRNRKTHQYAPLSRTTQWEYDAAGNVTKVINPDTKFTRKAYDTMNRVTDAWDERDQRTQYTYTVGGQVDEIRDPRYFLGDPNAKYRHAYDAAGRMTSRTYQDNTSESWTYDAAGNKITETTRTGQILRLYYDDRHREYWRAWDNNAAPHVGTQYDAAGRATVRYNWNGWLTYVFDAAGQVTSETQKIYGPTSTEDGKTETVTFGYDLDGNRTSFGSTPIALGYLYNNRQQLATIRYNNSDWATYQYTAAGERRFRTLVNGTVGDFAYDGAGRLGYLNTTHGGTGILLQRFGYDVRDRRTWQLRDDQYGDVWEYFDDSQLKKQRTHVWRPDQNSNNAAAFTDTFDYDPAGNRTSWNENGAVTTYTADSTNRYTAITGLAIQHDGRGNVTQLGGWSFGQNPENRMTRATGPGHDYRFHYDAQGRLSKIVDYYNNPSGAFEYRFYDGSQQFWRVKGDGTWLDLTIWGPTPDEVISRYVPGSDWWSNWQFYHQDPLNSVVAVTSHTGAVRERYKYDAFGEVAIFDASWTPRSTSAIGNRWLFTGQEWFAEIGIHNYKARWYCNRLWRFLQNDPIRFDAGDLNLYRYCENDGVNRSDPTGCMDAATQASVLRIIAQLVVNADAAAASAPPQTSAQLNGIAQHTELAKGNRTSFPQDAVEQPYRDGAPQTSRVAGSKVPDANIRAGEKHNVIGEFKTGEAKYTPTKAAAVEKQLPKAGGQTYTHVEVRTTAQGGARIVTPRPVGGGGGGRAGGGIGGGGGGRAGGGMGGGADGNPFDFLPY